MVSRISLLSSAVPLLLLQSFASWEQHCPSILPALCHLGPLHFSLCWVSPFSLACLACSLASASAELSILSPKRPSLSSPCRSVGIIPPQGTSSPHPICPLHCACLSQTASIFFVHFLAMCLLRGRESPVWHLHCGRCFGISPSPRPTLQAVSLLRVETECSLVLDTIPSASVGHCVMTLHLWLSSLRVIVLMLSHCTDSKHCL